MATKSIITLQNLFLRFGSISSAPQYANDPTIIASGSSSTGNAFYPHLPPSALPPPSTTRYEYYHIVPRLDEPEPPSFGVHMLPIFPGFLTQLTLSCPDIYALDVFQLNALENLISERNSRDNRHGGWAIAGLHIYPERPGLFSVVLRFCLENEWGNEELTPASVASAGVEPAKQTDVSISQQPVEDEVEIQSVKDSNGIAGSLGFAVSPESIDLTSPFYSDDSYGGGRKNRRGKNTRRRSSSRSYMAPASDDASIF
ncbi:hypothetical protein RUND412_004761 [Rhizina undulata]